MGKKQRRRVCGLYRAITQQREGNCEPHIFDIFLEDCERASARATDERRDGSSVLGGRSIRMVGRFAALIALGAVGGGGALHHPPAAPPAPSSASTAQELATAVASLSTTPSPVLLLGVVIGELAATVQSEHEKECEDARLNFPIDLELMDAATSRFAFSDADFETHDVGSDAKAGPDAPYLRGASRVHLTRDRVVSEAEIRDIVEEASAAMAAGVTSNFTYTKRHNLDEVHTAHLPAAKAWLTRRLSDTLLPLLADRYGVRASSLRVFDSLIIHYDAAKDAVYSLPTATPRSSRSTLRSRAAPPRRRHLFRGVVAQAAARPRDATRAACATAAHDQPRRAVGPRRLCHQRGCLPRAAPRRRARVGRHDRRQGPTAVGGALPRDHRDGRRRPRAALRPCDGARDAGAPVRGAPVAPDVAPRVPALAQAAPRARLPAPQGRPPPRRDAPLRARPPHARLWRGGRVGGGALRGLCGVRIAQKLGPSNPLVWELCRSRRAACARRRRRAPATRRCAAARAGGADATMLESGGMVCGNFVWKKHNLTWTGFEPALYETGVFR